MNKYQNYALRSAVLYIHFLKVAVFFVSCHHYISFFHHQNTCMHLLINYAVRY
jgi:hypothetical protein